MKPTRLVIRALVALLVPLAALLLAAGPTAAHGGDGQIEITSIEPDGEDVTVVARLTYLADGHGVPDATVTVVVGEGTPVPMEPGAEEGEYTATVPAAPDAPVRVTSVEPATSAEATVPRAQQTPTTGGDETTTTEGGTTGDVPTTQASAETVPEPNGIDEAPDEDGGGGDVLVLVVLVVVVAGAIGAVFLLRRKKPGEV